MSLSEPQDSPRSRADSSPVADVMSPAAPSRGKVFGMFLVGAFAAAFVGNAVSQRFNDTYVMSKEMEFMDLVNASPEDIGRFNDEQITVRRSNALIGFAIMGAAIAGLFGLVAGLIEGNMSRAVIGLVAGVLLGALLGTAAGYGGATLHQMLRSQKGLDEAIRGIITHVVAWILIGIAAATAVYLAAPRTPFSQLLVAAIGGSVLGGLLYSPTAFIFGATRDEDYLPMGNGARMYFMALYTIFMGLAMASAWCSTKSASSTEVV